MSVRPGPATFIKRRFGNAGLQRIRGRRPTVQRQLKNVKKSIHRLQRDEELKHKDTSIGAATPTVAGSLVLLNNLSQGDSETARTADEIRATSIQVRGLLYNDMTITGAGASSTRVRMILFWDRQPNGAAPTVATLLDTSVASAFFAPYNDDYQKRYKILKDVTMDFNPNWGISAGTTQQNFGKTFHFKRRLARRVQYDGNAGTIADIQTNSLYILFLSFDDAEPMSIQGYTRFIFKDD